MNRETGPKGNEGMVVVSSCPLAAKEAMKLLNKGGTAADAGFAAVCTQIVASLGSYTSFGGMCTILYFEAASGTVWDVSGEPGIPAAETDYLEAFRDGGKSGRAVLVPGVFMALEALNRRFGRLSLDECLEGPIKLCFDGIQPSPRLINEIGESKDLIKNLPEQAQLLAQSNLIYQAKLGETLTHFGALGADYVYKGRFAEEYVNTVQAAGGKLTRQDMADYRVDIRQAVTTSIGDCEVYYPADPNRGSLASLFGLKLLCRAGLSGHYSEDGATLARFIELLQAYELVAEETFQPRPEKVAKEVFGKADLPLTDWLKDQWVDKVLDGIGGLGKSVKNEKPDNTDAVITIDSEGNMAVVIHSAAGSGWSEGLQVGGVWLCNPAKRYPALLNASLKGGKMRTFFNPTIFVKDGLPYLGSVAMHAALYEKAICALYNVLEHKMKAEQAQAAPYLLCSIGRKAHLFEKDFDPEVLEQARALGAEIGDVSELPLKDNPDRVDGLWIAAQVFEEGNLHGVTCPHYDGLVMINK